MLLWLCLDAFAIDVGHLPPGLPLSAVMHVALDSQGILGKTFYLVTTLDRSSRAGGLVFPALLPCSIVQFC